MHELTETVTISEAQAQAAKKSGRFLMQFISPGWGSSGYYAPKVLEAAVTDQVIAKGTHMYADHPTDLEAIERPGRSIKDLMAVVDGATRLATEADVATWGADLGAVVGEVKVVPAWRDLVDAVKEDIGVSVRGDATDITEGEAEGRTGRIIEGFAHIQSVDFVTKAGRGGKVLTVLESAAANHRALNRGVSEATVNDTREALQTNLRDLYGSAATDARVWVYVRDFDETTVWFEVDGGTDAGIYAQTYAENDGAVSLTGTRTEVRQVTKYVPVTRPDSTTTTTEASKEDTMGSITIEESEHTRLTEAAGRVATLESERDTAVKERDEARGELAEGRRREAAIKVIADRAKEAKVTFTTLESRGLLADLPVKDGELDVEAFTTTVNEAAAEKTPGVTEGGFVTGMGADPFNLNEGGEVTQATVSTVIGEAFGRSPVANQVKEA